MILCVFSSFQGRTREGPREGPGKDQGRTTLRIGHMLWEGPQGLRDQGSTTKGPRTKDLIAYLSEFLQFPFLLYHLHSSPPFSSPLLSTLIQTWSSTCLIYYLTSNYMTSTSALFAHRLPCLIYYLTSDSITSTSSMQYWVFRAQSGCMGLHGLRFYLLGQGYNS